ncbi:TetR/AcrR family transcriptional regulator [Bacillus sp. FJAT-45037]|uniref:TetR/AcrR family transcriptional regulator n=1 Tax=Bacillus sp. FJAT-45037 TaxID=2011007 RepID=UPI000C241609|nr:TetR/AcrR family transcriptional regulator [Bacillus sp. FJAT-45037]
MSPRKSSLNELTKEMIVNEAREQFIEKDYQQVSMRSIAKQLSCSHGALYYHFENKAELFYAVIEGYFYALNKQIEEIVLSSGESEQKLRHVLRSFIEFGLNHQSQYELMFMTRNKEVDGLSHDAANRSYQTFAKSVHSLSSNVVPISDVYSVFVSLHGFVSHYRGFVKSYQDAEDAAFVHIEFLMKALHPA